MYFKGQDYICGKRKENLNINIFTDAYSFLGGTFLEVRLYCQGQNHCMKYKRHLVQAEFSSEGTGTQVLRKTSQLSQLLSDDIQEKSDIGTCSRKVFRQFECDHSGPGTVHECHQFNFFLSDTVHVFHIFVCFTVSRTEY